MKYLKSVSTRKTPSGERVPGRTDQVVNSAGGFVFEVDEWARLDRFLVMGSEGGTFYVTEKTLTLENAAHAQQCLAKNGKRVVDRIVDISDAGRAKSNDPALFVLAMAASVEDEETRRHALAALPKVARIGTHLFHFVSFVRQFRGHGRALNRALQNWYLDMPLDRLALQAVKYKQRDGWSHRDILRLCKPKTPDPVRNEIFKYMTTGVCAVDRGVPVIIDTEILARTQPGRLTPDMIRSVRLPREAVPTDMLDRTDVWRALLTDMPTGALVRNLGKMGSIGLLAPMSETAREVYGKLTDAEQVRRSRIHPLAVMAALATYSQGHGLKGRLTWSPDSKVIEGLGEAFELSFGNVVPTNLRTLIALDVSGSMGNPVHGLPMLSCRDASAAMATILLHTEPWTHTVAFSSRDNTRGYRYRARPAMIPMPFTRKSTMGEVLRTTNRLPFGGTDCALPMLYATEHGLKVDAFHLFTDSEHWAGDIHPFQALQQYRQKSGINASCVVWAMAANQFSVADPRDARMLDVIGLDAGAPSVVNAWLAAQPF